MVPWSSSHDTTLEEKGMKKAKLQLNSFLSHARVDVLQEHVRFRVPDTSSGLSSE